ncbi:MAG: TylF/MycF/NovP-related O-methyltransferase [Patescibacteria group bacterium]
MYQSTRHLRFTQLPKAYLLTHPQKLALVPLVGTVYPYTQLHFAGLCQMYDILADLRARKVQGAFVELGAGRGGCGAFVAKVSKDMNDTRPLWLLDSFEGLSEPTPADLQGMTKVREKVQKGYLRVAEQSVTEIVGKVAHSELSRVHIVKGWFSDTVPANRAAIGAIAILRLDADLYEPTIFGLRELYDSVVEGGYVVIDDYKNWIGARRALFEFFHERGIAPYVQEYPAGGAAYFVKRTEA